MSQKMEAMNKASRLTLGTAQFGMDYGVANQVGKVPGTDVEQILQLAWDQGVRTLDTAVGYGDCESLLGGIGVQDWNIVTKLPPVPDQCPDIRGWVFATIEQSLQRLQCERLSSVLLHASYQLNSPLGDEIYRALQSVKEAGLVRKVGMSIYATTELDTLCNQYVLDIVQAPCNLLDRRLQHSGWLAKLAEQHVEVHARSVFLQGVLLMPPVQRPPEFARFERLWQQWEQWQNQTGLTPYQLCIEYVAALPGITQILVGVDSVKQLQQLLDFAPEYPGDPPADLYTDDVSLLNPLNWDCLKR